MLKQEDYPVSNSKEVAKARKEIEEKYLQKISDDIEEQNRLYFEMKARSLLMNAEEDPFSKACANLLI
jgi:hypothetical protein